MFKSGTTGGFGVLSTAALAGDRIIFPGLTVSQPPAPLNHPKRRSRKAPISWHRRQLRRNLDDCNPRHSYLSNIGQLYNSGTTISKSRDKMMKSRSNFPQVFSRNSAVTATER